MRPTLQGLAVSVPTRPLNNNGTWRDQLAFDSGFVNTFNASSFNNAGTYFKEGSSHTDLSAIRYVNTGTTDVRQGTLVLPANSANPGRLMGNGTIVTNLVTNSGRIAPDELTGTLTMTGAFAQTASGTLDIELRNLTSFDLLVGRRRCLDGHLQ